MVRFLSWRPLGPALPLLPGLPRLQHGPCTRQAGSAYPAIPPHRGQAVWAAAPAGWGCFPDLLPGKEGDFPRLNVYSRIFHCRFGGSHFLAVRPGCAPRSCQRSRLHHPEGTRLHTPPVALRRKQPPGASRHPLRQLARGWGSGWQQRLEASSRHCISGLNLLFPGRASRWALPGGVIARSGGSSGRPNRLQAPLPLATPMEMQLRRRS